MKISKLLFGSFLSLCLGHLNVSASVIDVAPGSGTLAAAAAAAVSGDTLVLADGGLYEEGTVLIQGKVLTIMGAPDAAVKPTVVMSQLSIDGADNGVVLSNIRFDSNGGVYFIDFVSSFVSASYLKLWGVDARGFGRTIIRGNRVEATCDTLMFDNCTFFNFNDGYRSFHIDNRLSYSYFSFTNSTVAGFDEAFLWSYSASVKRGVIDNCTFYDMTVGKEAFVRFEGDAGSSFKITDCIFASIDPVVPLWTLGESVADTISNCVFFATGDTTNAWDEITAFTEQDPQFISPAHHDYSLPIGSPLLTAGTDGGQIGDPRWGAKVPPALVAHWKFDEESGLMAADELGTSNGTLVHMNGDEWVAGQDGNALDFSAAGDDTAHVLVPDNDIVDFDSTTSFTISALVKTDPFAESDEIHVVFKGNTGVNPEIGAEGKWYTLAFKSPEARFTVDDNVVKSQLGVNVSDMYPSNRWAHLVGVRDMYEDSLKLYLNGKLIGSLKDDTEFDISSGDLPLVIGNNQNMDNAFRGQIDDLRFYNYPLTAEEVGSLYDSYDVTEPNGKNVVFVTLEPTKIDPATGENADQPFIDDLFNAGYDVIEFYDTSLETASEARMDTLNNADLVVIGRSTSSGDFGGTHKAAWNAIEAPILTLHLWTTRNNRMNWFNTGGAVHYDDVGVVLDALIHAPDDPVFEGLAISDSLLPWCVGPYDVLDTQNPGNGQLLASSTVDGTVQYVRFDPWVEFYDGAGDMAAGYRVLMGNGNDNTSAINYDNFTEESKTVYMREAWRLANLPRVPQPRDVVFVTLASNVDSTGQNADMPFINELDSLGYNITLFYNNSLETASQATIDTLNNADLVIIGRTASSGDFGGTHKEAWNAVKAPLMTLHLFTARNNRMNWLNTSGAPHYNDPGVVLDAIITAPDDPVFDGLSVSPDSLLPWCVGPYDVIDTKDGGNGQVVAISSVDSTIQFVRFDPWVEFYAGAGDMPAGYRTMIGNGNDNTGVKNYYNFTEESRQVYLREVARMAALGQVDDPTSVETPGGRVPETYQLSQNYPNPFNPTTNIQFQIPKDGHVTISIYNTLGQRVATLLDESLKSGVHQVTFDASHYSSGVYFYRIKAAGFTQVRKMMLIK